MLILSRKSGESIVIDGRVRVKVVRVEGDVVKVGIEAPADVPVHREEVYAEIQRNNQLALTQQKVRLPKLPLTARNGSKAVDHSRTIASTHNTKSNQP
jgi:carbon storage regulator